MVQVAFALPAFPVKVDSEKHALLQNSAVGRFLSQGLVQQRPVIRLCEKRTHIVPPCLRAGHWQSQHTHQVTYTFRHARLVCILCSSAFDARAIQLNLQPLATTTKTNIFSISVMVRLVSFYTAACGTSAVSLFKFRPFLAPNLHSSLWVEQKAA